MEDFPLFSEEELEGVVQSVQIKKAPRPDGVVSEVLKVVHRCSLQLFLDMFNAYKTEGIFSTHWKVAWLVLINNVKGTLSCHHPTGHCTC